MGSWETATKLNGIENIEFRWHLDLYKKTSYYIGYGPPCARARGGPRARASLGLSGAQGFSPHGEVKMT